MLNGLSLFILKATGRVAKLLGLHGPLVGLVFVSLASELGTAANSATPPSAKADSLFDAPRVLKIELAIPTDNVRSLEQHPKQKVKATLIESGKSYTNVAVHLKGLGSFRPITDKASFSIKFNEHVPNARFHGHSRILLENSTQDPAYLRRKLTSELALKAGLPAARVTYAVVELNGRKLGFYTLSEAMNTDFLARHFGSSSGDLFEGSNQDLSGELELDSGNDARGKDALHALVAACEEPDLSRRLRLIETGLDVERLLSFMALEVLISHHDGYSMDLNNYRLYHDPKTQRFTFIPHGMDLVFNRWNLPLEPPWTGLAARAVMETNEGRKRYRERIRQMVNEFFGNETLINRIDELVTLLRPTVASLGESERKRFESEVGRLKENIRQRSAFVLDRVAK